MIPYPSINPTILKIGPLSIRWYGLMYLFGFFISFLLALREIKRRNLPIKRKDLEDLYFYLFLGLLVGARLGYVIFYNINILFRDPLEIFYVWHGGMSFHGGLIGACLFGLIFIKKRGLNFFSIADLIIPTCPIGLFLGRIGNFINGELYGRPSSLPWAMIFPEGGQVPRHPSQLYEALLEGILLFIILWSKRKRKRYEGELFALFFVFYGSFRIFCEFFREPDPQIGFILGFLTMGQLLSLFMIFFGLFLRFFFLKG